VKHLLQISPDYKENIQEEEVFEKLKNEIEEII
jgi:hypothetical protein